MKRFAVTVVVLLALLIVADRAAAALASRAIAAEVASATRLDAQPDVDVAGFPFLTQALSGRYRQVDVTATDVPAGELTIGRLVATLTGVEVPLSDALSGSVSDVPVQRVRARALVTYDELERQSEDRRLTLQPEGDRVRVTGTLRVLGQEVSASALSRVNIVDGAVVVTAESYEVGNAAADAALTRALGERLDLRIPVTGLPYDLQVSGVEVDPDGVVVLATANATVLTPA